MQSINTIEYYKIRAFLTYDWFLNILYMQAKSVGVVGEYGKMASAWEWSWVRGGVTGHVMRNGAFWLDTGDSGSQKHA